MNISSLRPIRGFILMVALLGFVVINLPFLYFAFFEKAVYDSAMTNGVMCTGKVGHEILSKGESKHDKKTL